MPKQTTRLVGQEVISLIDEGWSDKEILMKLIQKYGNGPEILGIIIFKLIGTIRNFLRLIDRVTKLEDSDA
jgi:hypothetical protein